MSPTQLRSRSDEDGYVGTAGDVWAMGVLLVVMLLGMRACASACRMPVPAVFWVHALMLSQTGTLSNH